MRFMTITIIAVLSLNGLASAAYYEIRKISDSVYAAIANSNGKVASNAFFIITDTGVILAGAHFISEGVKELVASIGKLTSLPVNHVILTHHHKGFNYIDFDLPEKAEVLVSVNVWQALKEEHREFLNHTLVFENVLTLNRGKSTLVLMNAGPGHSSGDVIVYLPKEGILFASDLLFNDSVGFMGEASIHEWGESLEMMENLVPLTVIPGVGAVSSAESIARFRKFYQAFMTEIIRNVEKGNTLAQTKKQFDLPQYKDLPGYSSFLEINIERAYKQYKTTR